VPEKTNRFWFIHGQTGTTFQVDDPISWCVQHRDEGILAPARDRLVTLGPADADRIVRLVVRRCKLTLLDVRPRRVLVHFWSRESRADLRSFFKVHGLAHDGIEVMLLQRKEEFIWTRRGDDFLYGEPHPCFPWDVYQEKWMRRNDQEADDWTQAPESLTNFSWEGLPAPFIPLAVLKCIWLREQAPDCPNCETPEVMLRFWWRRRVWVGGLNSYLTRGCFACRRVFIEDFPGNLLEWVVKTLERGLWPTHHRLARTYDLTRDYADLLKRLEDTGASGEKGLKI
jgi:hypothetical protein